VLVHLALQIARMRNEEAVLAHAFPEYASYCARTARIVPGVY
jgi:protein-S-isoprenylcysteine O-methyltransferase Ste14